MAQYTTAEYTAVAVLAAAGNAAAKNLLAHPDQMNSTSIAELQSLVSEGRDFVVRAASTTNLSSISGLSAIDGVTPVAGDFILLKNQSPTASQNGIWVAASGAWTRAVDIDGGTYLSSNMTVKVREGGQANTSWKLTTNDPITVGTTALTFSAPTTSTVNFALVQSILAAATGSVAFNSQKLTTVANGTALTDVAALGQLMNSISAVAGAKSGKICNVVCGVVKPDGSAISGAVEVMITLSPKSGTGTLAAATVNSVGVFNWTAGGMASMTTSATGLFSFNIADTAAEDVVFTISSANCKPNVQRITLTS